MSNPVVGPLAFYLPSLAGGGAERVVLALMEAFAAAGAHVSLLLGRPDGMLSQAVPRGVRCIVFGGSGTLADMPALMRYLHTERPTILVSSMGHNNVAALLAARATLGSTRVVVCQHNSLASECGPNRPLRFRLLPLAYRMALPLADAVVAVSNGVARELEGMCARPPGSVHTLYNPAWSAGQAALAMQNVTDPWLEDRGPPVILGVGRLVAQKDFATLIDAFAYARMRGLEARLLILGEGPERAALAAQIETLGVARFCRLAGFCHNPYAMMARARLLVMSSRYEGFGNVLVEALGCGTPVVSTDCPHGPVEIVDGGRFGELVPLGNVPAMAAAIARAMAAVPDRAALRARAEAFSLERAVHDYACLFTKLCSPRCATTFRQT